MGADSGIEGKYRTNDVTSQNSKSYLNSVGKSSQNPNVLEKRVGKNVIKQMPRVSIVTPAYNVAEYIAETLDSALAQTFKVTRSSSSTTVRPTRKIWKKF